MRKIILVTSGTVLNARGSRSFALNITYMNAVAAGGGIPVMMGSTQLASDYADLADGLLLTGGESIYPKRYGETFDHLAGGEPAVVRDLRAGCDTARDEMEFTVFEEFYKRKKPIMGICRGHQLVNAAMGGANMLNFPRSHPVEHCDGIQHEVTAEPGSILERLYGTNFMTNSYHRDCAVSVGDGMRITARTADGMIEAIEHISLPIFSVQFHPERMRGDTPNPAFGPDGTKLFQYFVNLC